MLEIAIDLSEEQQKRLGEIARATGKTPDQLIHEAVDRLITGFPNGDRLENMRQGRGIWKDRQDLPSLEELRTESNRYS